MVHIEVLFMAMQPSPVPQSRNVLLQVAGQLGRRLHAAHVLEKGPHGPLPAQRTAPMGLVPGQVLGPHLTCMCLRLQSSHSSDTDFCTPVVRIMTVFRAHTTSNTGPHLAGMGLRLHRVVTAQLQCNSGLDLEVEMEGLTAWTRCQTRGSGADCHACWKVEGAMGPSVQFSEACDSLLALHCYCRSGCQRASHHSTRKVCKPLTWLPSQPDRQSSLDSHLALQGNQM